MHRTRTARCTARRTARCAALLAFAAALLVFAPAGSSAKEPAPRAGTTAAPSGPIYQLPFKGQARRCSQASSGKTHKGRSSFALDFGMPRGTPLYAARAGIVTRVVRDKIERPRSLKREKGPGKPNSVRIRHADGTSAVYLHLQTGGVVVKVGQTVKAGQLIGYSGSTGKSSGPHLHFAVFARGGRRGARTIPVQFLTARSERTTIERRQRYRNPLP